MWKSKKKVTIFTLKFLFRYYKFQKKETIDGLVFRKDYFRKQHMPVFSEEIWRGKSLSSTSIERLKDFEESKTQASPDVARSEAKSPRHAHNQVIMSYLKQSALVKRKENYNLVFFVHGYLGSTLDMDKIMNVIANKIPNPRLYAWTKIEDVNNKSLEELGKIIAEEIRFEIEKAQALGEIKKISFVGHSMGGLVLRAAFEHLEEFRTHFYMFMTLATPHLGYMHSQSKLVSIGMWAISRVSSNPALSELRLSDGKNIKSWYLYDLSKKHGLDWFKSVYFIGSKQDNYAPIESSLLKLSERLETNYNFEDYKEMCANTYKLLKKVKVYRVNFNFEFTESSLDTYIGRMAHIQFLDNADVIRLLVYRYFE